MIEKTASLSQNQRIIVNNRKRTQQLIKTSLIQVFNKHNRSSQQKFILSRQ